MKLPALSLKTLSVCIPVLLVAGGAAGCAPNSEFQTVPQEGASRTGVYPRFTDRPHGQTQQFTPAESTRLSNELVNEAKDVRSHLNSRPQRTVPAFSTQKEDARREAEEVLRQIEQGK